MTRTVRGPALFGMLLAGWCQDALAYLDPGTGSMLLQGLIGGIAVAIGFIAQFRARLSAFFNRLRRRK